MIKSKIGSRKLRRPSSGDRDIAHRGAIHGARVDGRDKSRPYGNNFVSVPHTDRGVLRVIHHGAYVGALNMIVDEVLFRKQMETRDPNVIVRFYRFSEPAFTVGYGTWRTLRTESYLNLPLIRRVTGGGIVRHDSDLVYALVAPVMLHPSLRIAKNSYALIHESLMTTLLTFGISTERFKSSGKQDAGLFCFEAPVEFDLMLDDKKVAGAGQKRSHGYLLHQGSIAWDVLVRRAPDLTEKLFVERFSRHLAARFKLAIKEMPKSLDRHCEDAIESDDEAILRSEIASVTLRVAASQ